MTRGLMLITGATGLVGSHVAEKAVSQGYRVRALVRPGQGPERDHLAGIGVEMSPGDLTDGDALRRAVSGVDFVVHCAAKVGEWGPEAVYRQVNVDGLRALMDAVEVGGGLKRFVAISSLGVYEPTDHFGTDESTPAFPGNFDPYTRSKVEAEGLVQDYVRSRRLPAVILRPGFVYGARDRQVLPRLIERLRQRAFVYIGSGQQILNNTGARNIADAVMRALATDAAVGEIFNVTDQPLVSRVEFIETVARLAGLPVPRAHIPRWLARPLSYGVDRVARAIRTKAPPLTSVARYKFVALNLQFSTEKATRLLGYRAPVPFAEGMAEAVAWFRAEGRLK